MFTFKLFILFFKLERTPTPSQLEWVKNVYKHNGLNLFILIKTLS
jgi:hypothetical protein